MAGSCCGCRKGLTGEAGCGLAPCHPAQVAWWEVGRPLAPIRPACRGLEGLASRQPHLRSFAFSLRPSLAHLAHASPACCFCCLGPPSSSACPSPSRTPGRTSLRCSSAPSALETGESPFPAEPPCAFWEGQAFPEDSLVLPILTVWQFALDVRLPGRALSGSDTTFFRRHLLHHMPKLAT